MDNINAHRNQIVQSAYADNITHSRILQRNEKARSFLDDLTNMDQKNKWR